MKSHIIILNLLLAAMSAKNTHAAPPAGKRPTLTIALGDNVALKMILVQPGKFKMGSPANEEGHKRDETNYEVELTKPYWLAATELTQAQWTAVMGVNPSHFTISGNHPVECVSWEECVRFCEQLSEALSDQLPADTTIGLPTEAQWEYACRAGTTTPFSMGTSCTSNDANIDGTQPYNASLGIRRDRTRAVASFNPNPWGFYDMHGNVSEWVQDKDFQVQRSGGKDPDPESSPYYPFDDVERRRVFKGGDWASPGVAARSGARQSAVHLRLKNGGGVGGNLGVRPALVFKREIDAEAASETAAKFAATTLEAKIGFKPNNRGSGTDLHPGGGGADTNGLRQRAAAERTAAKKYKDQSDELSRRMDSTDDLGRKAALGRQSLEAHGKYQAAERRADELDAQADALSRQAR